MNVNLVGTTYGQAAGANNTIVTAAANTKGVFIAYAQMCVAGGAIAAGIKLGANQLCQVAPYASTTGILDIKNTFIPAGVDVILESNNAAAKVFCHYKVL